MATYRGRLSTQRRTSSVERLKRSTKSTVGRESRASSRASSVSSRSSRFSNLLATPRRLATMFSPRRAAAPPDPFFPPADADVA